jgi:lipopolysaccharide biosynthesis glycosyltransferase
MNKRGAVIFLFDRKYIEPFKVFTHSLRHALDDSQEDLVVLTDDDEVERDAFVSAIGAKVLRLTSGDIERLRTINSRRIRGAYRTEKVSAYFLLKFYLFKELGYDYHIFLDADMLCLDPHFAFGDLDLGADFCCARTLGQTALGLVKGEEFVSRPDNVRRAALEATLRHLGRPAKRENQINSGVMFMAGKMLGDHVVSELIQMATADAFRLDQDVIHEYILRHPDISFASLSVAHNFPTLPAYVAGPVSFAADLEPRVSILHFNRQPKPWLSARGTDYLVDKWWKAADDAAKWFAERSYSKAEPEAALSEACLTL